MAFMCGKGHMHGTQHEATNCYICKRRALKKSAKHARREQQQEEREGNYPVRDKSTSRQLKKFRGD